MLYKLINLLFYVIVKIIIEPKCNELVLIVKFDGKFFSFVIIYSVHRLFFSFKKINNLQ
jgi:hypothetical protein